nr:RNA-directed DNA polymerase homolog [Tanacetum cinerariifolium]
MEEMVNKFIEEGEPEHEEMKAFIREFRTTNKLLLKERNNSLSELKFEVYGLSKAIKNAQLSNCEVKGLLSNKIILEEACTVTMNEICSVVLLNKLPSKKKDPGSFTIPCDIGHLHINNALTDLGTSSGELPTWVMMNPNTMFSGVKSTCPTTAIDCFDELTRKIWKRENFTFADSPWVSPIHVVPKKGGIIVVLNDDNELMPSSIVTGWHVCIDYHKLNDATRKDHFPLPFIDQMLERLSGNEYYYFLDGFSGFFQILIALEYQEKTTFTCPYGTFAYMRISFGLCNAPATFQRCMTTIFHDMVDNFMEVIMDDFSVLLLQGFNIEIKVKKEAKNLDADHLLRLKNLNIGELTKEEITDEFLDEHLMVLMAKLYDDEPW